MTSPKSGATIPTGAHPQNTGGKKGRSGRKPLWFKRECQDLADGVVLKRMREYLGKKRKGPGDPTWRWCAEKIIQYGHGKPPQPIVGDDDADPIRHEIAQVRDRIVGKLARAAAAAEAE